MREVTLLVSFLVLLTTQIVSVQSSFADDKMPDAYSYSLGLVDAGEVADTSSGGFEIEAGSNDKDSTATLKLSLPGEKHISYITFSAPLDKETGEASFSEFDVFKNAASVEFNLQWQSFKREKKGEALSDGFRYSSLCDSGYLSGRECWDLSYVNNAENMLQQELRDEQEQKRRLTEEAELLSSRYQFTAARFEGDCQELDFEGLAEQVTTSSSAVSLGDAERESLMLRMEVLAASWNATCQNIDRLNAALKQNASQPAGVEELPLGTRFVEQLVSEPIWVGGITGKYGTKDYEFFQEGSTETSKRSENPWEMSAYLNYGVIGKWATTVRYAYAEGYKPAKTESRCDTEPVDSNNFLKCASAPGKSPDKVEKDLVSLNLRTPLRFFSKATRFPTIAVAPKATYDFDSDEVHLALPIYFSQKSKNAFNGGLKVEWDDEDGTVFSVFIGKKLDLLEEYKPSSS